MPTIEDPRQEEAIASQARNLLITAPPGCGKTDVLARRTATLIQDLRPGQRVLALTFSNKARENLQVRLRQVLGPSAVRQLVTVRNYHGHALEVAKAHGRTVGSDIVEASAPSRRRDEMVFQRAEEVPYDKADVRLALSYVDEAKMEPISDEALLERFQAAGESIPFWIEQDRRARNEIHFADLLRVAQLALRVDAVARLYQSHYAAVVVDEFQDLTPQQLDIVLRTCTRSRTFAGDQMQGIYSWAGARPIEISAELNALCDEQIALTTSFRSSPAVLRTVNTVASALGAAEPLTSHDPASWVEGGYASATQFRTSDEEANWLVGLVRTVSSIRPDWTIGVITRSAWRGREVEAALMEAEVNAHRWSANLGSPEVFSALQGWHERFPTSPLVLLAEDILAELDSDDPHLRADVDQAIRELVAQGITTLRGMMESPHYGAWESTPIPPGVHILNAHQGKGHQFDWVVVLGLEEKHIPDGRARDPNSLREELRVLLVMLSRAKHGLTLTRRAVTQAPWGPSYPRASRWWTLFDSIVRDGDDALEHLQRLT